jgi:hypothetical protein
MHSVAHHTFIQPNKLSPEGITASSWITKTQQTKFRSTGAYLGGNQAPLLSSHEWAYCDGPGSYLFQMGAAPNFPSSWGLYPLACTDLTTQTPWEASLAIQTKCPEACLGWIVSPGVQPQPNSQGGKNDNCGLFHSQPMHQKCCGKWGKQSHWDYFYKKQGVYCANGLRGDNFSKLWAPDCDRSWVKYLQSFPLILLYYLPTF